MKYFKNSGKYQQQFDNFKSLVPLYGKAATIEGEIYRAASNLYNDYYRCGFSNNCSGELNYLLQMNTPLKLNIENELLVMKDDARYLTYTYQDFSKPLEIMVDNVIVHIVSKLGFYTANNVDCLSFMESDYYPFNNMKIDLT